MAPVTATTNPAPADTEFALSEVWEKGGEGGIALAEKVLETLKKKQSNFKPIYADELSLAEKIETVPP